MSQLFSPVRLRDLEIRNRVWVSPMCQYSSVDGLPNDWHLVHLGVVRPRRRGAGVHRGDRGRCPRAGSRRRTPGSGTTSRQARGAPIVAFVHGQGARAGIQLAHAGRKASTQAPVARPRRRRRRRRRLAAGRPVGRCRSPGSARTRASWTPTGIARSSTRSPPRPGARSPPASTCSRCTPRTATCCTSSSRRCPTSARTSTAARSRTASGCCSTWSTRCAPSCRRSRRCSCASPATDWTEGGWTVDDSAALAGAAARARRRPGRRLQRRQRRRRADPGRPGLPGRLRPPGARRGRHPHRRGRA